MMEIIMKIWFFIVILPYFMGEQVLTRLNGYLEKHGKKKIETPYVLLFLLIVLLLILLALGYR